MMTGYLSAKGIKASEGRVGKVLRSIHQPYHAARQQGARNLNPIPYRADYMGHKLHVDQNEKPVMFGVTHMMATDGFSKKVVGHSTMSVKNNIVIYDEVFRSIHIAEIESDKLSTSRTVVICFLEADATVEGVTEKVKVALSSDEPITLRTSQGHEGTR
ncbi:uncharacterized protein LOC115555555, partial [Xyrichtys novacula]